MQETQLDKPTYELGRLPGQVMVFSECIFGYRASGLSRLGVFADRVQPLLLLVVQGHGLGSNRFVSGRGARCLCCGWVTAWAEP
jgi:hypothetical protein